MKTTIKPKRKSFARKSASAPPSKNYAYNLPFGPRIGPHRFRNPELQLPEVAAGAVLVHEQLLLAHRYRNMLIEIRLRKIAGYRAARRERYPRLVELETALELWKALEKLTAEQKAIKKLFVAEHKAVRAVADQDDVLKTASQQLNEVAKAESTAARANCNTYWGSYLLVERSLQLGDVEPEFQRWTGESAIGVQLQGGLTVEKALACKDTRLRLENTTRDGTHGTRPRQLVHMRVGSTPTGKPVWATFEVAVGRSQQLPADGVIKEAKVVRRLRPGHVGQPAVEDYRQWVWTLVVSVEAESFRVTPKPRGSAVAINPGFRVTPDGLRVCYAVGSDGEHHELRLPADRMDLVARGYSLASISDTAANAARLRLVAWLASNASILPEWLALATAHIALWKAHARLDALVRDWRGRRFDGDAKIFEALQIWHKQHGHLRRWEHGERESLIAWRTHHYRAWAIMLATRYSTIVVDNTKYTEIKRCAKPREEDVLHQIARRNMKFAAPGKLRAIVVAAGVKRGCEIIHVSSVGITATCHVCGVYSAWDHAPRVRHMCENCGAEWDQDANAARNVLTRASSPATPETGEPLADEDSPSVTRGSEVSAATMLLAPIHK